MEEKDIQREWSEEKNKKIDKLGEDIIREANTSPKGPAGEKENLDIIKHLIKRSALHQLLIEKQAKQTNLWLSVIAVIGVIYTILSYYK